MSAEPSPSQLRCSFLWLWWLWSKLSGTTSEHSLSHNMEGKVPSTPASFSPTNAEVLSDQALLSIWPTRKDHRLEPSASAWNFGPLTTNSPGPIVFERVCDIVGESWDPAKADQICFAGLDVAKDLAPKLLLPSPLQLSPTWFALIRLLLPT